MAITGTVTHQFVATIPEDSTDDPGIVGPTAWNAQHQVTITGAVELPTTREDDGTITVDADDDDHILCGAGACTVNLPAASTREAGRPFKIIDYALDADSAAKTIVPNGVETILGLSSWVLDFRGASVELYPRPDGGGWYI